MDFWIIVAMLGAAALLGMGLTRAVNRWQEWNHNDW